MAYGSPQTRSVAKKPVASYGASSPYDVTRTAGVNAPGGPSTGAPSPAAIAGGGGPASYGGFSRGPDPHPYYATGTDPPRGAEVPDAPEGPAPVPGGDAMAAMSNPALAGLASAFTDPGPGFRPDQAIDGAQPGLGMRVRHQPLDILRQIVAQRGRAY